MDFEQFISEFSKHYPLTKEDVGWYKYKDEVITIGVVGYDNEFFDNVGKVYADTMFNKWSQCYYQKPIPVTIEEFNTLLLDLKIITEPEHIERSNSYERYQG